MVSMKDISVVCGVSVATVSKALNDQSDIGKDTKERIRQTAEAMGYFSNSAAKMLKTNRSYNIGVLFAHEDYSGLTHDYYAFVLDSLKRTVEQKGYDITFINTNRRFSGTPSYLGYCRSRGFDGIAIVCTDFYSPEILELVRSDIPTVTLDHLFHDVCAVMSNNVQGMQDLLTYVWERGHRRIAYIHGADSSVTQSRLASFYRTAEQLGLAVPDEYIRMSPYRDTKGAYRETMYLLGLREPPTCILYPDDFSAFGGYNAIQESGLRVPEDISIAGYDGIRVARHIEPTLTTLWQDTEKLGCRVGEKLISLIEHPKTTLVETIVVEGRVFAGNSVVEIHDTV
ncbi:MAG: LacI family transcriptional regulator [Bacteroidales bacterium]|nr:LacI family transcriptional regulator [Bacteroidales bacterium]MCM1416818.1 LacI family transcriptional regulator [bacterium]MCM1424744.1 LacI family transcriptional regulator [bacterium]